ncbi:MAG: hypothetical protein ISS93_01950 [Candidatus Aenigmarchaeota archaeon]|nr:hypothetical protein [Candidatus Aenigmarchaeota archaeon]
MIIQKPEVSRRYALKEPCTTEDSINHLRDRLTKFDTQHPQEHEGVWYLDMERFNNIYKLTLSPEEAVLEYGPLSNTRPEKEDVLEIQKAMETIKPKIPSVKRSYQLKHQCPPREFISSIEQKLGETFNITEIRPSMGDQQLSLNRDNVNRFTLTLNRKQVILEYGPLDSSDFEGEHVSEIEKILMEVYR